ncbi:MAG: hypothetical protein H0X15_01390 [Acidobacteria bacterium]|jgi:anti-sigma regulatory factor (Ser/Thr protein kinase)|nr:hypothetical protein [Acidobacteriota bacterium]MBA4124189.1 hypothetical protein [Acidobacteriota bacterium]
MEIKNTNSIASIDFAEVKISVDELEVYATALSYALEKLSDKEIELKFGASRDEIEGIVEDLQETLTACGKLNLIAA